MFLHAVVYGFIIGGWIGVDAKPEQAHPYIIFASCRFIASLTVYLFHYDRLMYYTLRMGESQICEIKP